MTRLLLLLGLLLATVAVGPGQPKDERTGFGPLNNQMGKLYGTKGGVSVPGLTDAQKKDLVPVVEKMAEDLEYLRVVEKKNPMIPEAYQADLDLTAKALKRAIDPKEDLKADERIKLVKAVAKHTSVKREVAQKNEKPYRDVKVTVRTLKGKEEAKGYQVWYVTQLGGTPKPFDKFSSPTNAQALVAGGYYVWSQDPDNKEKKGPQQPLDANSDKTVDIPAP